MSNQSSNGNVASAGDKNAPGHSPRDVFVQGISAVVSLEGNPRRQIYFHESFINLIFFFIELMHDWRVKELSGFMKTYFREIGDDTGPIARF